MLNTYKRTYRMVLESKRPVFRWDSFPYTELYLVQYNQNALVEQPTIEYTCVRKTDNRAFEFDYDWWLVKYNRELDLTVLNPMPLPIYDPWGKIIDKI